MIGIISKESEIAAVKEFFQLFKTPWEMYASHRAYDLVISTGGDVPADANIGAIAIYDSQSTSWDRQAGVALRSISPPEWLQFEDTEFPLYGDVSVFEPTGQPLLQRRSDTEAAGFETDESTRRVVRIGYDLFQEVAFLLSKGQPARNADVPTLEIHIALLRNIMARAGVPFVEVLPVPAGYDFMACLTHDVDFTGIREHKFDSTLWGFIYRALIGSFVGALSGRVSWSKCGRNWQAVLSLPLVYAGLADDFWLEFDRYMEIEKGLGSTFFFIPFRNRPGTRDSQLAPKRRAAKYDLLKIKREVRALIDNGCEVGLHGIDAWQSSQLARTELGRIQDVTGKTESGVRMHWLYWSETSPKELEDAGLDYDSTFGYNDAIGFRPGTSQVFCPLGAESLLELPLAIQDTALFYPDRMNLSADEAMKACQRLFRTVARFGGAVTVNWHTRSLSPERLWEEFYRKFLTEMQKSRVWFGTARQVVDWFRSRRALQFKRVEFVDDGLRMEVSGIVPDDQPFVLRVHHPKLSAPRHSIVCPYLHIPWKGEAELALFQPEHSQV